MRQDFFAFKPQFKLIIVGNHKPSLRSVDESIRRRFHLVPFAVTIPPEKRDKELAEKLRCEWPGILQWGIEGCVRWQKEGLRPPQAVVDATASYLEAEDSFSAWMEECCILRPGAWESSAELFASWRAWAEQSGEFVGAQRGLSEKLGAQGFLPKQGGHAKTRGFEGIRLKEAKYEETSYKSWSFLNC